ncbi:MAG: hypothetical protein VX057_03635 [Candidatus Thermoplasmatota archaeon]|nr:hypothetical protein [Candidatus Thermoplasmatota archaeon]
MTQENYMEWKSIQADRNITLCLSSCSTSLGDRVSSNRTEII